MPDEKPIKQNTIERSKSARASCKDCGGVIAKGEPRFCLVDFKFSEHGSYKYYHLTCAHRLKPREVEEVLATKGDALDVPREEIEAALRGGAKAEAVPVAVATAPDWLAKAKSGEVPDFARDIEPPRTKDGQVLDSDAVAKLVTAMKAHSESKPSPTLASWVWSRGRFTRPMLRTSTNAMAVTRRGEPVRSASRTATFAVSNRSLGRSEGAGRAGRNGDRDDQTRRSSGFFSSSRSSHAFATFSCIELARRRSFRCLKSTLSRS